MFAVAGSNEMFVGFGIINLAEVLAFPQNKIQLTIKIMSTANDCDHELNKYCACNENAKRSKHLGNLTIWFRLTCEWDILKSFASKKSLLKMDNDAKHLTKYDRIKIQKNDTTNVLTSITIGRLKLFNFVKLRDEQIKEILIEYNFLGHRKLRTNAQPLNTDEIIFNCKQTFYCSERNNQRLKNLLKNFDRSVKIMLIAPMISNENEQHINSGDSISENNEIGFGLLHLGKIVNDWINNEIISQTFDISIMLKKPPYENIGSLEISIDDIKSLKQFQDQINKQN